MNGFMQIHTGTHVRCGEKIVFPAHLHSYVELVYVWRGGFSACINGVNYRLGTGDMLLVFPNCVHYFYDQLEGLYFCSIFSCDDVLPFAETLRSRKPKTPVILKKDVPQTTVSLLGLLSKHGTMGAECFSGVMTATISGVIEKIETIGINGSDSVREILNFCLDNYRLSISLSDLSAAVHISQSRLSHIFKEKIGLSFKGYINYLRVHEACTRLNSTSDSISNVAFYCGFDSIRSFNRNFTAIMGITPSQFRAHK